MMISNTGGGRKSGAFNFLSFPRKSAKPRLFLTASKDGAVLFDPEQEHVFKLNSTAIDMWRMLNTNKTDAEVSRAIALKHGMDECLVRRDLTNFVHKLAELDFATREFLLTESLAIQDISSQALPAFPWYGQGAKQSLPEPSRLTIVAASLGLLLFDFILSFVSLKTLCSFVRAWPIAHRQLEDKERVIGEVCNAVAKACVWYRKTALCLQRSAVTACLLRRRGIAARLVIAARPMPFKLHAWVEADGAVLNDFPAVRRIYQSLTSY
jgi:hypothetical protein